MLGGGMAEAAGGDGFPHAEAGDQPSVEDVAEAEVEVLGGEEGGRVDLANFRPVKGGLSGRGGEALFPCLDGAGRFEGILGIDESR
jgi:hypothetical protein